MLDQSISKLLIIQIYTVSEIKTCILFSILTIYSFLQFPEIYCVPEQPYLK